MPIYLPPLSRRRSLTRSVAAGTGAMLGYNLLGDGKRPDSDSWALLSDTHLAANRTLVVHGVNMTDYFMSVARELEAMAPKCAGVFVNGDCAYNTGEKSDYALMAALLEPIRQAGMPVHIALGNHDNRQRFWEALQEEKAARRPLKDRQVALVGTSRANWFVLDSLEQTAAAPGMLGGEQLDWLARSLDDNRECPALILIHHNPGKGEKNHGLKDTEALFEVIRPRKQVKAYIFGHTHVWKVERDPSGIHLINLPPVGFVFRDGEPSGWVHAALNPKGMRIELRCVDQAHKAHGQVVELDWRAS